jgi:hypothetical protein
MKLPDPQNQIYTVGFNSLSATAIVLLTGIVFNAISPWWLLLQIPLALTGFNCEVRRTVAHDIMKHRA